jgi:hypothetical protein
MLRFQQIHTSALSISILPSDELAAGTTRLHHELGSSHEAVQRSI